MPFYKLENKDYKMDETKAMVIVAKNEESARKIASENIAFEIKGIWFDKEKTSCTEIVDTEECLILSDVHWG